MTIPIARTEGTNQTMFISGMDAEVVTRKGVVAKATISPRNPKNDITLVDMDRSFSPNQCSDI